MSLENKTYYYHLTCEKGWGKELILRPRDYGGNRSSDEPNIPRICVSDCISGCFVSVYWWTKHQHPKIYRTKNKILANKPHGFKDGYRIYDSHITQEHWIEKPIKFKLLVDFEKEYIDWMTNLKNSFRITRIEELTNNGDFLGDNKGTKVFGWQKRFKNFIHKELEKLNII